MMRQDSQLTVTLMTRTDLFTSLKMNSQVVLVCVSSQVFALSIMQEGGRVGWVNSGKVIWTACGSNFWSVATPALPPGTGN